MKSKAKVGRVLAILGLGLTMSGFCAEASASYAIPTVRLANGDVVNLDNGAVFSGRNRGGQVSRATLEKLRRDRGMATRQEGTSNANGEQ